MAQSFVQRDANHRFPRVHSAQFWQRVTDQFVAPIPSSASQGSQTIEHWVDRLSKCGKIFCDQYAEGKKGNNQSDQKGWGWKFLN